MSRQWVATSAVKRPRRPPSSSKRRAGCCRVSQICLGKLGPNAEITELLHEVERLAVGTGRSCLSVIQPPTADAHIPAITSECQCAGGGDPCPAAGASDEHVWHDRSLRLSIVS